MKGSKTPDASRVSAGTSADIEPAFRRMIDSLPLMVCALNPDGTIAYWSPECERVTGYVSAEIVGNPAALEILSPDPAYRERILAEWHGRRDADRPWYWQLTCKDASLRTIAWSSASGRFPAPGRAAWGFGIDITDQQRLQDTVLEAKREAEAKAEARLAALKAANKRLRQEAAERIHDRLATRQTQQQLEDIIDNASASIVLKDLEGRYLLANRRAAWRLHKNKEYLVGKTDYDLLPKATADLFRENDRKALESKTPFETEDVVVIDDAPYTYLTLKFPLRDAEGKPYAVCTIATDITNRKRAEERLRLLSSAIEQTGEGVAVADLEGNLLFVNDAFARMHGYAANEILGKPLSVFHTAEQMPAVKAANRQILETGEFTGEIWHVRRDGTSFPAAMHNSLLRDDAGRPVGMIGTVRNIVEQKAAEETLRESERKYRELVESANSVILRMDAEGRITFFNEYAQKLFGYAPEEILGRRGVGTIVPETETSGRNLAQVIAGLVAHPNGYETHENENITRDGRRLWIAWTNRAIRDADGKVTGVLCIGNDITDRKRMEQALRYRADFETLMASLSSDFINLASDRIDHGIRQALQAIGEFSGVDRSYVFLRSDDQSTVTNTHEWCGPGIEPQKDKLQQLSVDVFPWMRDRLERFEVIHVPRLADLPPEAAAERRYLEGLGTRSCVCVPMVYGSSVIGFLGFASTRAEKTWDDDIIALLRFAGGIFVNALQRKRAEEAVRASEENYRRLFDYHPAACFAYDGDGIIRMWNRGAECLYGYKAQEVVGRRIAETIASSPKDRAATEAIVARVFRGESVSGLEWMDLTADGEPRWVLTNTFPIQNEKGQVILGISSNVDITEHKRAEEAMRESQRALATLMSNLPGMAYRRRNDREATMEFVSEGCFDLTGYHPSALIMNREISYGQLIHPDDREPTWQAVQTALQAHEPFKVTYRIRTAAGNEKWVWGQGRGVYTPDGEVVAIEGFATDITERKQAEKALEESETRFRTVTENSLTGVYILQEGRFLYVNPAFTQIFGYSREEIEQHLNPLDTVHPDDRAMVAERIRRRLDGHVDAMHYLFRGVRKDGVVIHCEVLGRRIDYRGAPVIIGTILDVTERKRAEDALQDSEARTRAIVNTAADAIITASEHGIIESFNPAASRIFGYSPGEVIGRNLNVLMPEPYAGEHDGYLANYARTGVPRIIGIGRELVARRKDGTVFPIDLSVAEVRIGDRRLFTGIVRDITERKRAENALRAERNLVSAILDTAGALVIALDTQGRVIRFNRACEQVTGYTFEDVEGRPLWDVLPPPDEVAPVRAVFENLRAGQFPNQHENYWIAKDGTRRLISWSNTVILDARGEVEYIVGTGIDITDRERAERALRESEERHRTILDQMQEAVSFADAHDIIRHINACACEILKTTREQTVGRDILSVHPEALRPTVAEVVRKLREDGGEPVVTVRRTFGDREMMLRFSAVRGPAGEYWGIIANFVDITEQVRMQQHLAEARRRESVGTLAGGIAHDFNNLMATVLGCASYLKARRRPDHPDYESLAQIERAAETAGRLAHQLLVYAKGGRIRPKLVDFREVIARAVNVFRPSLPPGIRFELSVADDLAPVECDTTQVEQVIVNLCRNAVDAMPHGGRLTVRATNEVLTAPLHEVVPPLPAGDYVRLTVEDTGSGMDPETAERVFDPFFTTKPNGYGLGLAAAYGTITSHGGAIALTTRPGEGTTFRVWLPRARRQWGAERQDEQAL
jgi:two-component system cell cycle sensor histidine kinase/response regulator CckA